MDAALWTAIGLVAATAIGTLFYVGTRFDALAGRMDARFDAMDARFDSLTGRMEARFDALDARMDGLGSRLDAHLDRHAS